MAARPWTLGIDLGTTNSTAVVFDGETLEPVRTSAGSSLTPSVVRITAQGTVVVGERARRFLERDPDNTHGGFKRLLGTSTTIAFPASGQTRRPADLSAEVLRALLADLAANGRPAPTRAVVTVPALFELPQTEDTARAAKAAGLKDVEMLQEPVASALAGGFRTDGEGCWLVYDLGGGTFDASLVVGEEGMLSVVGHDGDNYLGGRDFDALMAALIAERMADKTGVRIEPKDPAHQAAWRALLALAEDAKIELSRSTRAAVTSDEPLSVNGKDVEVDVVIERGELEERVEPLIERSIEVCHRLLDAHGRESLDRIVLVGGPTAMPRVRTRVAEALGPLAAESLDPMTLVAQGAALFAAQRGLWCSSTAPGAGDVDGAGAGRPSHQRDDGERADGERADGERDDAERGDGERGGAAKALHLRAPPVSTDLLPFVVGSVVDPKKGARVSRIRLVRDTSTKTAVAVPPWQSAWVDVDEDGGFAVGAELLPRRGNTFIIEAVDDSGAAVAVEPSTVSILQGVTIGNPPVSRSVGVAMASGEVHIYLEKGLPLPARRTFVHHTVETIVPGAPGAGVRIPLVQGEYGEARFCRLIGALEIHGEDVDRMLPAGSAVEVTLELDRGGRMTARAVVPSLERTFEEIATLVVPEASVDVLQREAARLLDRLGLLRAQAGDDEIALTQRLAGELIELELLIERAAGGDVEAAQRARRAAIDLEAQVAELEARKNWPALVQDAWDDATWASMWIARYGSDVEKRMLQTSLDGLEKARKNRSVRDLERQRRSLRRLGNAAYLRHDSAYIEIFESYASRVHEATNLQEANKLVEKGRKLADAGDNAKLIPIVERLHQLLPFRTTTRRDSHASGVR